MTTDTSLAGLKDRRVLPRWRDPMRSVETVSGSFNPLAENRASIEAWWTKLNAVHDRVKSKDTERDIIELQSLFPNVASPTIDSELSLDAKSKKDELESFVSSTLDRGKESETDVKVSALTARHLSSRKAIKLYRGKLRRYPSRALVWAELSRHYAILGQRKKADRAMAVALKLTRQSCYLYRAATRLYVSLDDPERALHLLKDHHGLVHNPWLLSAEIAVTSLLERTSPNLKRARELVESGTFSPLETSELAAGIATIELEYGAKKKARRWFETSLRNPTENALAQVQWASDRDDRIAVPNNVWAIPDNYEARALFLRTTRETQGCLAACRDWYDDEPFSERPPMLGSYIGVLLEDVDSAIEFATAGLHSDPDNEVLLNNRAVARAYSGDLRGAIQDIKRAVADVSSRTDPHLLATLGLISFRGECVTLGRQYYTDSVRWFKKRRESRKVAEAVLFWLREEVTAESIEAEEVEQVIARVKKVVNVDREPELLTLIDSVSAQLERRDTKPVASRALSDTERFEIGRCAELLEMSRELRGIVRSPFRESFE